MWCHFGSKKKRRRRKGHFCINTDSLVTITPLAATIGIQSAAAHHCHLHVTYFVGRINKLIAPSISVFYVNPNRIQVQQ